MTISPCLTAPGRRDLQVLEAQQEQAHRIRRNHRPREQEEAQAWDSRPCRPNYTHRGEAELPEPQGLQGLQGLPAPRWADQKELVLRHQEQRQVRRAHHDCLQARLPDLRDIAKKKPGADLIRSRLLGFRNS